MKTPVGDDWPWVNLFVNGKPAGRIHITPWNDAYNAIGYCHDAADALLAPFVERTASRVVRGQTETRVYYKKGTPDVIQNKLPALRANAASMMSRYDLVQLCGRTNVDARAREMLAQIILVKPECDIDLIPIETFWRWRDYADQDPPNDLNDDRLLALQAVLELKDYGFAAQLVKNQLTPDRSMAGIVRIPVSKL
jgi:hypothetical protein